MDMMFTMLPRFPVSTKCRTTRCIVRKGPRAFVLKCLSQSSRLVSRSVPRSAMPAEFTRPLTLPKCAKAFSTSLWQSSAFETSVFANRQSLPRERTLAAAASPFSAFRPLTTMPGDPSSASLLAIASPRPCVPPVITAMVDRFLERDSSAMPGHFAAALEFYGLPKPKRRSRCLRQINCA
jgi:hypothetical protein